MTTPLLGLALFLGTVLTTLGAVSRARGVPISARLVGAVLLTGLIGVALVAGDAKAAVVKIRIDDTTDKITVTIDGFPLQTQGESLKGLKVENILKNDATKNDAKSPLYFFLTDPGGGNDKKGDVSDFLKFTLTEGKKSVGIEFQSDPLSVKDITPYDKAEETGAMQPIPLPALLKGGTNSLDIMVASDKASGGAEPTPEPSAAVLMALGLLSMGVLQLFRWRAQAP